MKQLKKTLLTLVALLALTTGAWADDYFYLVVDGTTATLKYGDKGENPYFKDGFVPLWKTSTDDNLDIKGFTTITVDASCQNLTNLTSLPPVFQNFTALTVINNLENINTTSITRMAGLFYGCSSLQTLDLSDWNTASVTNMMNMFKGCLSLETIYVGEGWSTEKVTTSLNMFTGCTKLPNFDASIVDKTNAYAGGYLKAKPGTVLPTPNVNEWSLTMPAGNVTLEPEYYPQAALTEAPTAINDVPATTDGAIVKVGTVANIGSTTTAQGTVMYYVSTTALDDDALLALDADAWTADVPTAESLAEGQAYVYYYVRGNDSDTDEENFSDGDILAANALTVTIAAEPTYAVTFADGVNPEPPAEPEWTADPNADVKKGQTVTVTYSGDRKVIGVKAEKKAAAPAYPMASEATAADYGKVVCAAGHLHDAKTAVPEGCTAVAVFAYIDGGNKRMGIALQDAENATWNMITTDGAYNNTLCAVPGTWNVAAPTDAEWFVGTKEIYEAIFTNLGSTTSHVNGKSYDDNVNAFITTGVGGTALSDVYWCTTSKTTSLGWKFSGIWSSENKTNTNNVRPVLGF